MTAVVTFALSLKFEKAPAWATEEKPAFPAVTPSVPGSVSAPVSGKLVNLEDIPDETFAAGVLGQGVGIIPSEGVVKAPFSGTVSSVADSKHAIGLESPDGLELLIHVGVNTVDMQGKGFTLKVKEGDTVTAGQELMTFDRKAIAEAGHPDIVVVLLTNSEDYENVTAAPAGPVMAGTEIIHI